MRKITDYFKQLGFSEIEARLYQGLLEIGQSSVMELADHIGVNRITAHFNTQNLIKDGLITQTMKGSHRQLVAESPENLKSLIEEKKEQLKEVESKFPQMLEEFQTILTRNVSGVSPFFKYYEGEKGFKEVCQRSLDHAKKEILFISNLDEWYKVYTVEYDNAHYIPIRLKNKIPLKMLVFKTKLTQEMKKEDKELLREIKFLPSDVKFNSTIIIYENEVSMMISSKPYTAIVINNKEYFKTFKGIFSMFWGISNSS
jgi:sugar-specific transcriptional regulator TrmB